MAESSTPKKPRGRPRQARGRRNAELLDLLRRETDGYDAIVWLAKVAAGLEETDATLDQRITCAREVASYQWAKLKAVEVSGEGGGPVLWAYTKGDELL